MSTYLIVKYEAAVLVTDASWTVEQCLAEAISALSIVEYVFDFETGISSWEIDCVAYESAYEAWDALISVTDPDGEYIEIRATSHDAAKSIAYAQEAA